MDMRAVRTCMRSFPNADNWLSGLSSALSLAWRMSRLIGLISICFEEISALLWLEEVTDILEGIADGVEGSCGALAEQCLQF
ncbi:hypothetical protein [Aquamicrobium defluvii]|uniref:hypothetical protein n=1 Tax=Aquamicrobium defluvii TaxID=69279 RepID=UPI001414CD80|nr:hypothetical protein [Aquamicrobium defluvii]